MFPAWWVLVSHTDGMAWDVRGGPVTATRKGVKVAFSESARVCWGQAWSLLSWNSWFLCGGTILPAGSAGNTETAAL